MALGVNNFSDSTHTRQSQTSFIPPGRVHPVDRAVWYGAVFAAAGILLLAHAAPAEATHYSDTGHGWIPADCRGLVQEGKTLTFKKFDGCDLMEKPADMIGANLTGSVVMGGDWSQVLLNDAILRFAHFEKNINMHNASMVNADMSQIFMKGADLTNANLMRAKLGIANLEGAVLTNATLRNTHLGNAFLMRANLSGADLRDANATYGFFVLADLSGADLRDARMNLARLYGADLRGADLRGANLQNAEMWKTSLYNADLSGANFTGAHFYVNKTLTLMADEMLCTHLKHCEVYKIKNMYMMAKPLLNIVESVADFTSAA